jgi:GH15 family glucan-1,4-alpha-glucosidase
MARLIEDYGLIGDGRTAALVSHNGSIDWLCWPRFDSDACFAALLGTEDHGRWIIEPVEAARLDRRYQTDTLVLETDFITDENAVRLTDFMPMSDDSSAVVRLVTGLRGTTEMRMILNLRFDYGSMPPWLNCCEKEFEAYVGPDRVVLRSPVQITSENDVVKAAFEIAEGEKLAFVLSYGHSSDPPPGPIDVIKALARTQDYWLEWIGKFDKPTDWPEAVRRSLLTLKALIYRPTGGIVASPTTSLPEAPGGEMNWDYRYSWLRDATFTLAALLNSGFKEEARHWRDWLLRAVAGAPDKMRIMYRVDGSRRLEEWQVPWLPGFRWGSPIRIGNAASSQRQLDTYGELIDALHLSAKAGLGRSDQGLRIEEAIVQHVESIWQEPDQGMWESRATPRHYVYSKVSAWVAIDRFVAGRASGKHASRSMLNRMKNLRDRIHAQVCSEGYDSGLRTFVAYYGSQELDASLLLLPLVGFLPIEDERIAETVAAIERDLVSDGLVRRWRPHYKDPEGAFLACTCWLADCQMMQGRRDAAHTTFERLLSVRNDLGLLSEEYDVEAGRLAGNFPQALSHLALVQTALALCGPVMRRGTSG